MVRRSMRMTLCAVRRFGSAMALPVATVSPVTMALRTTELDSPWTSARGMRLAAAAAGDADLEALHHLRPAGGVLALEEQEAALGAGDGMTASTHLLEDLAQRRGWS